MKNTKVSAISVVLYAVAGLTAIFAVWSVVHQISVLVDNFEYVQYNYGEFSDNRYFYVNQVINGSNGLTYLIYALLTFAAGEILRRQSPWSGAMVVGEDTEEEDGNSFFDDEDDEDGGDEALELDESPGDLFEDEEE